jgi:hypothetical protein
MSAGINTCALLAKVQLSADSIWADNAKNKDYIGNVEALTAIRENQTVRFAELENPMKDKTVTLYWPELCDTETTTCTDDCTPGGTKPGTTCQDYTLNICREVDFSVDEKTYRALAPTFEEAVAASLLSKMTTLDNYLASLAVTALDAGKGVNAYTGGKGTVAGFSTTIPAAYWNASLFGYLSLTAKVNKFNSPYLISGTNLYEAAFNANANSANGEGKGASNLFKTMPTYFDVFNIDGTQGQVTYLVNRNALAFVSKTYNNWSATDARVEKWGGPGSSTGSRYQIESKNLPGVFYDVIYKIACSGNEITHNWKIQFNGGIFRNPVGCNVNNTNILELTCS